MDASGEVTLCSFWDLHVKKDELVVILGLDVGEMDGCVFTTEIL